MSHSLNCFQVSHSTKIQKSHDDKSTTGYEKEMETFFEANPGFKSYLLQVGCWTLRENHFWVFFGYGKAIKSEENGAKRIPDGGDYCKCLMKETWGFTHCYCMVEHLLKQTIGKYKTFKTRYWHLLWMIECSSYMIIWVLGKPWTKLSEIWTRYFVPLRWSFGDFLLDKMKVCCWSKVCQKTSCLSCWRCISTLFWGPNPGTVGT